MNRLLNDVLLGLYGVTGVGRLRLRSISSLLMLGLWDLGGLGIPAGYARIQVSGNVYDFGLRGYSGMSERGVGLLLGFGIALSERFIPESYAEGGNHAAISSGSVPQSFTFPTNVCYENAVPAPLVSILLFRGRND